MAGKITVSVAEAEGAVAAAIAAANTAPDVARLVAEALVAAEVDGQAGHGFSRVASYCAQARSGKVDGHARIAVERVAPAFIKVDAGHGFAYPALDAAADAVVAAAAETGMAAAAVMRSHHCGQAGRHVERLARRGLVALMFANTPQAMAPWGGSKAVFGTNPIAFAAPRSGGEPVVVDLSLSKVARGKVMAAARKGEAIPEGWALDKDGQPTTDAAAAMDGTMVAMGDAKGSALALVVEILAAALTGACYSFEAASFFTAEGAPPGVGQLIIGFDVSRTAGSGFGDRLEVLVREIEGQDNARLPGANRAAKRADAEQNGISVDRELWSEIKSQTG